MIVKRTWNWLIGVGFHLLYHQLAWTYDGVSWLVSLGRWRAWQTAALEFVVGPRVLEVGHGPGHMLVALAQRGHAVCGLDASPQMGRRAARRLAGAGLAGRVGLIHGRVQALPVADGQFECVLSQFPTPYILEPASLAAISRVLVAGGRLVILPEGHLTGRTWLHRFIAWLFVITGQATAEERPPAEAWRPFLEALSAAGFAATVHTIPLQGSEATVLVGVKGVSC